MPRPQVVVNVTTAVPRRGAESLTGTAFLAFTGGTGTTDPVRVTSRQQAVDAYGAVAAVDYADDLLAEGAPEVVMVRATGALADLTQAEWAAALGKLSTTYGMGQVLIPGVDTAAAHAALQDHAHATGRVALLDGAATATAAALRTLADARPTHPARGRSGLVAPWVNVPTTTGGNRTVPGSVVAAALAARGDAAVGHPNHAPAGDQGRRAGLFRRATGVTATYTDADWDSLSDAGVSLLVQRPAGVTLYGWQSLDRTAGSAWRQLNVARLVGLVQTGLAEVLGQYLFRQIDGRGLLFAEVEAALRGHLLPLWTGAALYGDTADEAFDVVVAPLNTPTTAAAGELRAAVEVKPTAHTERVVVDVTVQTAREA